MPRFDDAAVGNPVHGHDARCERVTEQARQDCGGQQDDNQDVLELRAERMPRRRSFEGLELGARVKATFLRGRLVCENGNVAGKPAGRYLRRPT